MKFKNNGKDIQVRLDDGPGRFKWESVKNGEIIELPEHLGRAYGFEKLGIKPKVIEGKIGKTKVETKQLEIWTPDDVFFSELKKIKGIGKKTALDIVNWGTKEKLIEQIKLKAHLPFRDDVVEKLKRKYG